MRRLIAALLAAGLVMAACGGESGGGPDPADDPKGALVNAFENLGEYDGIDMTLSLDTEAEDLVALGEGSLTEEQADIILNSSINVKAVGGDNPEDSQAEFVVDIDGSLIEMRFVDNVFYARGDVSDLVEKFGGDQAMIDQAVQEGSAQFDFVEPLADGEWVGFEGADALTQQLGAPSPDAELQKQLTADLAQAVSDSSTVESEGSDDAGEHLVATVNIKKLYDAVQASFGALTQMPGTGLPSETDIPDEDVTIDFWVEDGFLTQVSLDFVQFEKFEDGEEMPEGVDQFAMLLELEEFGDSIDAPDAAATVNLQELMGGLMGGLGGLEGEDSETGGGSGKDDKGGIDGGDTQDAICEALKDSPPEVQELYVDECPEFAN